MINETCSCGASIVVDYAQIRTADDSNSGYRNVAEENTVGQWRGGHIHQRTPPVSLPGDGTMRLPGDASPRGPLGQVTVR